MAERLHPGVYVEEVSSGVRPIEGVSTATAAFIGEAARGVPDYPHFLTSFDDFTSVLGSYAPGDKGLLAQAVQAFFANGGQRAYAVRVLPSNAQKGVSAAVASVAGYAGLPNVLSFSARGEGAWSSALRVDIVPATHFPSEAFQVRVGWSENGVTKTLETYDDVRMDPTSEDYVVDVIEHQSQYIEATDLLAVAASQTPATTVPYPELAPVIALSNTSSTYTVYQNAELSFQWWTGDTPSGSPTTVTITQTAVNNATTPDKPFDAQGSVALTPAELASLLGTALGSGFSVTTVSGTSTSRVEIRPNLAVRAYLLIPDVAALHGKNITVTWGNGTNHTSSLAIGASPTASAVAAQITGDSAFPTGHIALFTSGSALMLRGDTSFGIAAISATDDATPTPNNYGVAFNGMTGTAVDLLDAVNLSVTEIRASGLPSTLRSLGLSSGARSRGYSESSPANPALRPASQSALRFTSGSDGSGIVSLSQFSGDSSARTGLHALDPVDVNLVAMPGKNTADFIAEGISYCDGRTDCFFLADGPGIAQGDLDMTAADVKAFVDAMPQRSKNAAIYFPWIEIPDPLGVGRNPTRYAPPSGFMAGIYARVDNNRGVWKAPAGIETTVSGALGLQLDLIDADQDLLNPASLNCIRQFPASGVVTWGARTLSADPEWRYVPVRRMALFLMESLRRGMQWAVFEPNATPLWDQIRANINAFMLGLFRQGAFQGTTPGEAFQVKCDSSTNPQPNIDAGIVTAQVAFAPLKPAEFVVIQVSQKSLVS
jgi:phage tail sheath protein FI